MVNFKFILFIISSVCNSNIPKIKQINNENNSKGKTDGQSFDELNLSKQQ